MKLFDKDNLIASVQKMIRYPDNIISTRIIVIFKQQFNFGFEIIGMKIGISIFRFYSLNT